MNAQRVMRQLKREVKTNPKRAALLAGLTAVGIYFWAPLVAGWVMPDQSATAPVKKADGKTQASPAASSAGPATAQPTKRANTTPWTELWAAIQENKRTKPAAALIATADPFRPFPAPPEVTEETAETEKNPDAAAATAKRASAPASAAPAEATPKSLGMKLTGTVIGSRERSAVIDGKVVTEGDVVSPTAGDGKPDKSGNTKPNTAKISFHLAKVEHQSIVLERNKKKYTLTIDPPEIEGIEIEVIPPQSP